MKNDFIRGFLRVFPAHSSFANPAGPETVAGFSISTDPYQAGTTTDPTAIESGFIRSITGGTFTLPDLMLLEPGYFGFFNSENYQWIDPTTFGNDCCSIIIAGSPLYKKDAVSPFIRGYKQPIMTQPIKPQNVRSFSVFTACYPIQSLYALGNIPGVTSGNCCVDFTCGHSYHLKIKVFGDPTYGTYFRDIERIVTADGGCCPPPDCSSGPCVQNIYVDPNSIYFQWAQAIVADPELRQFVFPIFYDGTNFYYPPQKFYPDVTYQPGWLQWDVNPPTFAANQSTPFCSNTTPPVGGIILQASYIETRYGNCTFEVNDNYNYETVKIVASLWDLEASPCDTGLCFTEICPGHSADGTGEAALRALAFSETVRGFSDLKCADVDELRMRESEQANQLFNIINRDGMYVKYQLVVDIPQAADPNVGNRYTDTYRLEFYALGRIPTFEAAINAWLENCSQCPGLRVYGCGSCSIPALLSGVLPSDKFYEYAPATPRTIKIDPSNP